MTDTLKGPSGFDEARKEPTNWEARRTKGGWFAFRGGWESWRYNELTHPDTEWRRVTAEPMRLFTTSQVVALLEQDESLIFEAPDTDALFPCNASTDGVHVSFVTHFPEDDGGDSDGSPPLRDDWILIRGAIPKAPQSDPPAEMTAEQAMKWLRGGEGRTAIDHEGDAWQCFEIDCSWCFACTTLAKERCDLPPDTYTPLTPVTREQMTRVEELERHVERLHKAAKHAEAVIVELYRFSSADSPARADASRAIEVLREATKEGAGV